jgi:hypothetical protein
MLSAIRTSLWLLGISPFPGTCRRAWRPVFPYRRALSTLDGVMVPTLSSPSRSSSGVSFGAAEVSVKAGLLSAPDASEKTGSSKAFRGVVKAGFRNGAAVWPDCIFGENIDVCGGCGCDRDGLPGAAKRFGRRPGNLAGEAKANHESIR